MDAKPRIQGPTRALLLTSAARLAGCIEKMILGGA
jgi:hypothetical protein